MAKEGFVTGKEEQLPLMEGYVVLAQSGLGDYIFGLDPQLIFDSLITVLAMFVLFLFLSYLLFNPARNLMEKRREQIQREMETAAHDRADAMQKKEEYDEKIRNVEKESDALLAQARGKALRRETQIVEDAKEEARRILERADREAALEKEKVKDEVKQEMITVAAAMAGKVIEASMDEQKQAQWITDTLKEMGDETWQS